MSNTVFVVRNQQGLYLSKQQEWVDGSETQSLYRTRHRDEAINTVFEVSSRDIYLRAETVICGVDAKANPVLATAEPVTPAKAAQIARLLDADLEEESASAADETGADEIAANATSGEEPPPPAADIAEAAEPSAIPAGEHAETAPEEANGSAGHPPRNAT